MFLVLFFSVQNDSLLSCVGHLRRVTHHGWFLCEVGCRLLSFLLLLLLLLLVAVRALHLGDDLGVGLGVLYPLENRSERVK